MNIIVRIYSILTLNILSGYELNNNLIYILYTLSQFTHTHIYPAKMTSSTPDKTRHTEPTELRMLRLPFLLQLIMRSGRSV